MTQTTHIPDCVVSIDDATGRRHLALVRGQVPYPLSLLTGWPSWPDAWSNSLGGGYDCRTLDDIDASVVGRSS